MDWSVRDYTQTHSGSNYMQKITTVAEVDSGASSECKTETVKRLKHRSELLLMRRILTLSNQTKTQKFQDLMNLLVIN